MFEDLLDILFEKMPMGLALFDREARLTRCNPTWGEYIEAYTPSSSEQVRPGVSLYELAPGSEEDLRPLFRRVLQGETVSLEALRLQSGNKVSYWDVVLTPVIEDGEVAGVLDVTTDATGRVLALEEASRAIEALQEREARLDLVMRGTRDGIWDWNILTDEVYYSPRWKAMLGYADHEVENNFHAWKRLVHPDDLDAAQAAIGAHLSGETELFISEHRLKDQDGNYRWILARGVSVRDESGKPVRMAGSHTDITAWKKTEQDLRNNEANLRSLLDNAVNFVVYQLAPDPSNPHGGQVVMVSPSIQEILRPSDPNDYTTWFENVHPEDCEAIEKANRRSWELGVPFNEIARVYHSGDDSWTWLQVLANPVFDEQGNLTNFNGLMLDVSEQKRSEETLHNLVELQDIVTSISTNFINLSPGEVDAGINRALEVLGGFLDVDRAYVFRFSEDGERIELTHGWAVEGEGLPSLDFNNAPSNEFPWTTGVLRNGELVHLPSLDLLPNEARVDRGEYERIGITSLITVPMVYQGRVMGFITFDNLHEERTWPAEWIKLLKIVAEIFANALEHKRAQVVQAGQRQFLELLARGGSLPDTLHTLVQIIEEQWPGMFGLVLLLDEDGRHLHHGASVSLPKEYVDSIEGLEIGPQVGSCGTAAFSGERVIVEDINVDPRWDGLRSLALKYGLQSCWSQPVFDSEGRVIGTFAMYYQHPRSPTKAELSTIEISAHLAGVAVEHKRAQAELQQAYQNMEKRVEERTRELSTLLEVSRNLASTLELEPLLGVILDQLKSVVDFDGASILELEGDTLKVLAYRGPVPKEKVEEIRFTLENARANREVIERRQPVIIPDVRGTTDLALAFQETAGERLENIFRYIRCWMGIPLIVRDQVVGMLSLDHHEPNCYRPAPHSHLALAFANQVAVAIENARLYSQAQKRADETQTLYAVQQAITVHRDPDSVLQMIADEARRLTGTDMGAVYLLDGKELQVSVISGDVAPQALGYRLSLDDSVAGMAVRLEKPFLVTQAQSDGRADIHFTREVGAEAFIIVPLISSSGPIGTITVANKREGELGPEDERVLTMLASGAVVALENARIYQEEQERRWEAERRRQVAESLRDILSVLNSNRSLGEILDHIVLKAQRLLDTDAVALYRLESEQGPLAIQAAQGLDDGYMANILVPWGEGAVGRAAVNRRPVVVMDSAAALSEYLSGDTDPETRARLERQTVRYKALIAVPLIVKDELYGTVALYYRAPQQFSREDVDLAVAFADQAALAIENARLREQAQRSAVAAERSRLARDLHDAVTQTLFSASMIAEVLPRIWDRNEQEGRKRLDELRQLTRGALAEMRTLLLELRPSALIEAELGELFRHLTEAFTSRARVPVEFNVDGSSELPPDVKLALYRIAQEALNNIAKHAGADRVWFDLSVWNGGVRMAIRDDGRGFEIDSLSPEHLGLGIMKERAETIEATVEVTSRPGEGTEVLVVWKDQ